MSSISAATAGFAMLVALAASPWASAQAGTYDLEAMLHGAAETSEVSGYKGSAFTLGGPNDLHAVYGLFSVERRDNPCYLAVRTESINDHNANDGDHKDLCGKDAGGKELGVAYEDSSFLGKRIFVHGIRVCMNAKQTRVKGFQIRGKKIDENGHPVDLDAGEPTDGQAGGSEVGLHLITEPKDDRTNCKHWKRWVECPRHNQIATAVIAHFEAGKTPRSLTGVALKCRYASREYVVN